MHPLENLNASRSKSFDVFLQMPQNNMAQCNVTVAAKAFTAHTNHDYNDARRKVVIATCVFSMRFLGFVATGVFSLCNCPVRCWVSLPRAFLGLIAPVRFPACVLKLNAAVVLSKILPVTTYHRWVDRVGTSLLKTHV